MVLGPRGALTQACLAVSLFAGIPYCFASQHIPRETSLTIDAPTQVTGRSSFPVDLILNVSGADPTRPLFVGAFGLPPGLVTVGGTRAGGTSQMRVYGIVNRDARVDSAYHVTWYAKNGSSTRYAYSVLRVQAADDTGDVEARVAAVVTPRYQHGMPQVRAHRLGSGALPVLAKMLREDRYKRKWFQIAGAIGFIGDTSYFDTLRAFVWTRFKSPIDFGTFLAIRMAQCSLSAIATASPRALNYLVNHAQADSWRSIPWSVTGESYSQERICGLMAKETIIALEYTDKEEVDEVLRGLSATTKMDSIFLKGALRVHARVRAVGFVQAWGDDSD